jgi:hypothetical protein
MGAIKLMHRILQSYFCTDRCGSGSWLGISESSESGKDDVPMPCLSEVMVVLLNFRQGIW